MNGTEKNRIWLVPEAMPRVNEPLSPRAQLSESSVNIAVVIGTVRMEYGRVYHRRE